MRAEKLGIFRKEGIAILNHTVYFGKKKFSAVFQGKSVELSSANDEQGTVLIARFASSRERKTRMPSPVSRVRLSTQFSRPGRGPGSDSQVLRPIRIDVSHGDLFEPLEVI